MAIILTKTIKGKKVELDLITLNGKTNIRSSSFEEAKKRGLTKKDLQEAGFDVQE